MKEAEENAAANEPQYCQICKRYLHRWEIHICAVCSSQIEKEKQIRKKHERLETLQHNFSLEERIRIIEEWICDHEMDHPRKDFI